MSWLRRAGGRAPLVVAHRGASADAPENTLAAFAEGIRRGADMLELDLLVAGRFPAVGGMTRDRATAPPITGATRLLHSRRAWP